MYSYGRPTFTPSGFLFSRLLAAVGSKRGERRSGDSQGPQGSPTPTDATKEPSRCRDDIRVQKGSSEWPPVAVREAGIRHTS